MPRIIRKSWLTVHSYTGTLYLVSGITAKVGGPTAKDKQTTLGKYQILKKLAVGGMAEIYLARATGIQGFEKHVVLKRILPEHAKDQRFVEMFLDEARLAARLHHHNIAQVYDIGEANGAYFFSMEYLHGEDLRTLLKTVAQRGERIPLKHVLTIVAGACAGLHYAHEKKGSNGQALNIVHRDISPSNVIVTYDGGVKVVDFGIARATERSTETRSGSLKGKISYMSPEQCVGKDLDRRSDIFCLGIVLYELSTVTRLFRANPDESDYVVMDRIVNGKVTPPSKRVPDYPTELDDIVLKALQVDRENRYMTTKDMLIDIESYAALARIPLSTASLSRYLEDVFGPRPEPWHDLNHDPIEPEPVNKTVSTTGAVQPYKPMDDLEGTVLTISVPDAAQMEDVPTMRQTPDQMAAAPVAGAMTIPPSPEMRSVTMTPGGVIVNPGTMPPGTMPPGTMPPGTIPPGSLPPGTYQAVLNHSTGQLEPVGPMIEPRKKTPILLIAAIGALLLAGGAYMLGQKNEGAASAGTSQTSSMATEPAILTSSSEDSVSSLTDSSMDSSEAVTDSSESSAEESSSSSKKTTKSSSRARSSRRWSRRSRSSEKSKESSSKKTSSSKTTSSVKAACPPGFICED